MKNVIICVSIVAASCFGYYSYKQYKNFTVRLNEEVYDVLPYISEEEILKEIAEIKARNEEEELRKKEIERLELERITALLEAEMKEADKKMKEEIEKKEKLVNIITNKEKGKSIDEVLNVLLEEEVQKVNNKDYNFKKTSSNPCPYSKEDLKYKEYDDYLIEKEGYKTTPYKDGKGYAVCYGHWNKTKFKKNKFTQQECCKFLKEDRNRVMKQFRSTELYKTHKFTKKQEIILVGIVYNAGLGSEERLMGFKGSPLYRALLSTPKDKKQIKQEDKKKIQDAWERSLVRVQGEVHVGLERRRKEEYNMFIKNSKNS